MGTDNFAGLSEAGLIHRCTSGARVDLLDAEFLGTLQLSNPRQQRPTVLLEVSPVAWSGARVYEGGFFPFVTRHSLRALILPPRTPDLCCSHTAWES